MDLEKLCNCWRGGRGGGGRRGKKRMGLTPQITDLLFPHRGL